jgi:tetratricopeptide (TPR) repeat protein
VRELETDTNVRKAQCAEQEGRWVDAVAAWEEVTKNLSAPAWLARYGVALKEIGRWADAEQVFRSVLGDSPDCADALFGLGVLLLDQERLPEARSYLEKGLLIEERQPVWTLLGSVNRRLNDFSGARRAFERALDLEPNDDEAHYGLGVVLRRDDPNSALEHLRHALRTDPTLAGLHRELGHTLWYAKKYDEAEHMLGKAIQNDPTDAWAHLYLGHLLRRRGELRPAKEAFRRAVELKPDFAPFTIPLAEVCADLGDVAQADRLLRDTLARDPNDSLTNLKYGCS